MENEEKKNDNNNGEDDDSTIEELLVQKKKIEKNIITINIDETISDSNNYRKIFFTLGNATKNDSVIVEINSNGGLLSSMIQLYNSLLKTKATTTAEIYIAYSAASMIALACDIINVNKFSSMMIHSASWGNYGKLHEIHSSTNFYNKKIKDIFKQVYRGFLNSKEIDDVLKGKDLWLYEDEIKKHLKKWKPVRSYL